MLRTFACSSLATRRQFLFRSLFGAAFGAFCLNVDSTAAAEEANAFLGKETVLLLPPGKDNPRNSEGDFIRLKTGEILFVYTRYYASSAPELRIPKVEIGRLTTRLFSKMKGDST